MTDRSETLLGPYRALDLTDEKGFLCGRLLGDLGADVIKIEKPGGDPSRNIGPFYHDTPDSEKSLYWFAYNTNKRGITLDIETTDGKELFKRLVKTADWVIESFEPGYLEGIDLGYEALNKVNQGIIVASISPFGQSGPYKDYKGSDLVCTALGGYLYLCGDRDRAPVRVGMNQAYLHAGAEAADGAVAALHYRSMTGEGQQVDIAVQHSQHIQLLAAAPNWDLRGVNEERQGINAKRPGAKFIMPAHYECKDGYLYFHFVGGLMGGRSNTELVKWMESEGFATEFIKSIDWFKFDIMAPEVDQEFVNHIIGPISEFFKQYTKKELLEGGAERHIMLFPLGNMQDNLTSPQLAAREFWTQLEHPELADTITYPGPYIKMSETPLPIQSRAPLIGEHNEEIFVDELGLSQKELIILKQGGII
ncbi:CaiB/BaiF CoA transferase family protein [Thermodesulfobacteriota bacterium]